MFLFAGTSLKILTKQGTGQANSYMCCGQHITFTCYWLYSGVYVLLWHKILMPHWSRRIFWGKGGSDISETASGNRSELSSFPLQHLGAGVVAARSVCVLPSTNEYLILGLMNFSLLSLSWALCLFVLAQ